MRSGQITTGLIRTICDAKQREASQQTDPKHHISENLVPFDEWNTPESDQWELAHLKKEEIGPDFMCDHGHDKFVDASGKQECEKGSVYFAHGFV